RSWRGGVLGGWGGRPTRGAPWGGGGGGGGGWGVWRGGRRGGGGGGRGRRGARGRRGGGRGGGGGGGGLGGGGRRAWRGRGRGAARGRGGGAEAAGGGRGGGGRGGGGGCGRPCGGGPGTGAGRLSGGAAGGGGGGWGGGVGDDLPVEHVDLAGRAGGDAPVVGDEHDGHSVAVEFGKQGQHVVAGGRVEVAGGLVGQHDRRVAGQRPGDRDPLSLPPRQLGGPGARPGRAADQGQRVRPGLAPL